MPYTHDQIFAVDANNQSNIAVDQFIVLFAPGDTSQTPVPIFDNTGLPLANPVRVNEKGFGPVFISEFERVAWAGGEFSGFFTSYEGMKDEAVNARMAAQLAEVEARQAKEAAAASAQFAQGPTDQQVAAALAAAKRPTNLALSVDGVPYILLGASDITVYSGTDGNYYFTT